MAILTLNEVLRLAEHEGEHVVSMYMPAHRGGPQTRGNTLHLKNRLTEAQTQLEARGVKSKAAREFLEPAAGLLDRDEFWQRQSDGLAVLIAPGDVFRIYRLPVHFDDLTVVGGTFHILPLVGGLDEGSEYYVLGLGENDVRLLHGSRYGLSDIELPGAPGGVDELFFDRQAGEPLQFHSMATGRGERGERMFHGHGDRDGTETERLRHFMREVDVEVRRALHDRRAPLVFVGDPKLFPLYRDVSEYPELVEDFVHGNPDPMPHRDLHERTWPIVRQRLEVARQEAIDRVTHALGIERGATKTAAVCYSAIDGKVDTLLLDARRHEWGRYDRPAREITGLTRQEPHSEDLLNLAAAHTLRHGGRVFLVEPDAMPDSAGGSAVAAALRH